jgi:hypothetical protein
MMNMSVLEMIRKGSDRNQRIVRRNNRVLIESAMSIDVGMTEFVDKHIAMLPAIDRSARSHTNDAHDIDHRREQSTNFRRSTFDEDSMLFADELSNVYVIFYRQPATTRHDVYDVRCNVGANRNRRWPTKVDFAIYRQDQPN